MSAIKDLYDELGKQDASFVLGVHHNTLYKWYLFETGRQGGRNPNNAAIHLAEILMYLKRDIGWSNEDLTLMSENIKDI